MSADTAELLAEKSRELAAIMASPSFNGPSLDGRTFADALTLVGEVRRLGEAVGVDVAGQLEARWSQPAEVPLVSVLAERSPAYSVAALAGVPLSEAYAWCEVGAGLQHEVSLQGEVLPLRRPALAEAFRAGRIDLAASRRVLTVLDDIAPYSSVDDRDEVERFLVDVVGELSTRQFAQVCHELPQKFLPDDAGEREERLRRRSGVRVRHTRDGLVQWIVTMHPEAAGFLTAAVDARTAPRRQLTFVEADSLPDDPRPLSELRLDALVSMARESLGNDPGQVAGTSVTMCVTVTLDALLSGIGSAKIAGLDERISAGTARRLAADAEIIPVVLGGPSEQLDLGRAVRLSTEPQRRALALRDGGCIWPKCGAPPGWCEVAHIVAWAYGGATDLDNLMLLCPFHHRRFDNDGWQLEVRAGERYFIPPPWVDPAREPRTAGHRGDRGRREIARRVGLAKAHDRART